MSGRILQSLVSTFDPDEDERQNRARRWPVKQPQDAIDAACRAGHAHFTREPDPAKADQRYDRMPTRAKEARAEEFLVMASAFKAAGGRIDQL